MNGNSVVRWIESVSCQPFEKSWIAGLAGYASHQIASNVQLEAVYSRALAYLLACRNHQVFVCFGVYAAEFCRINAVKGHFYPEITNPRRGGEQTFPVSKAHCEKTVLIFNYENSRNTCSECTGNRILR